MLGTYNTASKELRKLNSETEIFCEMNELDKDTMQPFQANNNYVELLLDILFCASGVSIESKRQTLIILLGAVSLRCSEVIPFFISWRVCWKVKCADSFFAFDVGFHPAAITMTFPWWQGKAAGKWSFFHISSLVVSPF